MSSTQQPLFRIGKSFRFEATRRLDGGTYDGHSFTAEAVLTSMRLTPEGFVADFGDLAPLKRYIDGTLDHQVLNDYVEDVSNEGLARHLLGWAKSHLPADVVSVLEDVRVRTGRPQALPSAAFASFEASHQLHGLRDGHPCGRLHGHSYMLSVPVSAVPGSGTSRAAAEPPAQRHTRQGAEPGDSRVEPDVGEPRPVLLAVADRPSHGRPRLGWHVRADL